MKKHILYLLFFLSVMGLNTSCNYLDIVPQKQMLLQTHVRH